MHDVTRGAIAGAIATAPMTVAMVAMHRALPPNERYPLPPSLITEELEEKAGLQEHIDRREHRRLTFINHFGYGALCGAIFASTMKHPSPANGVLFGLGVWTTSYFVLLPALRLFSPPTKSPPRRSALMIAAHACGAARSASPSRCSSGVELGEASGTAARRWDEHLARHLRVTTSLSVHTRENGALPLVCTQ